MRCCGRRFLLRRGSDGELNGSGSDRTGTLALGATLAAAADGAERAGRRCDRGGEMDPERRQCEFPDGASELTHLDTLVIVCLDVSLWFVNQV